MPTYQITNDAGDAWYVTEPNEVAAAVRARNFPGQHKRVRLWSRKDQIDLLPDEQPPAPPAEKLLRAERPDPGYGYGGRE